MARADATEFAALLQTVSGTVDALPATWIRPLSRSVRRLKREYDAATQTALSTNDWVDQHDAYVRLSAVRDEVADKATVILRMGRARRVLAAEVVRIAVLTRLLIERHAQEISKPRLSSASRAALKRAGPSPGRIAARRPQASRAPGGITPADSQQGGRCVARAGTGTALVA
jgi:hypothetical protein